MTKIIEIEGIEYTESQIKKALDIEKRVCSPTFADAVVDRAFKRLNEGNF